MIENTECYSQNINLRAYEFCLTILVVIGNIYIHITHTHTHIYIYVYIYIYIYIYKVT